MINKLSKLQQAELDIFKEFVCICNKNNLKYFIWGGSFLGAIRHKGFIPWDDDIDVAMPRPDFERFLEIAPQLLSDKLFLSTYKRGRDHITLVAQVFNKNKDFVLNNAKKKIKTGAWLDILVIDGAPNPGIKRLIFGVKYMYYRMINQFALFDEVVNLNKKRPWYEKIAIKFAQITNIEKLLDPVKIGDHFHTLLKSNKYDSCEYIATFMGAKKMGEIMPKAYVGEGTLVSFEDMQVVGPKEFDLYLKHIYGDYMKLPPEGDRNRHNVTNE